MLIFWVIQATAKAEAVCFKNSEFRQKKHLDFLGIPLPSALITKFRSEKLTNSKESAINFSPQFHFAAFLIFSDVSRKEEEGKCELNTI